MANENTQRRQVYLPKTLEEWFIIESDNTGKRINSIILSALVEYAEKNSKKSYKKKSDFEKEVRRISLEVFKERGI